MVQEEEEERQREEEERQKKEGLERRKAERLERRAQLKREGKLLTGKAKKEAERLAAVREQFLKQAGMDAPGGNGPPAFLLKSFTILHELINSGYQCRSVLSVQQDRTTAGGAWQRKFDRVSFLVPA